MEAPATEEQILQTEGQLGLTLPLSFRQALLQFSAYVHVRWFLPDNFDLPYHFRGIFSGDLYWNIDQLVEINKSKESWVKEVFPNPEDEYDKVWHNKLAFLEVGNGDYLAFDLSVSGQDYPIVYLSHDDGEGHGYKLANTFTELLDNWSRVAFVGAEDWQWMCFVHSKEQGIDPDGTAAKEFRALLKIEL